jgi:hypothetical protein
MKKSKSFFSQLKVGRTPDKAGQHRCQVDETKTWRTNHVWSTSFVENTSRPNLCDLSGVNLGNFYLSNQFNLCNLWLKMVQSKITNYAKQTQFPKKSNGCNASINNELQRKNENGHLVKTKPNKANL